MARKLERSMHSIATTSAQVKRASALEAHRSNISDAPEQGASEMPAPRHNCRLHSESEFRTNGVRNKQIFEQIHPTWTIALQTFSAGLSQSHVSIIFELPAGLSPTCEKLIAHRKPHCHLLIVVFQRQAFQRVLLGSWDARLG